MRRARSCQDLDSRHCARTSRRPPPGLHIVATEDGYVGTGDMRARAGERAGARTVRLDWWMLQDPARGAAALDDFPGRI